MILLDKHRHKKMEGTRASCNWLGAGANTFIRCAPGQIVLFERTSENKKYIT